MKPLKLSLISIAAFTFLNACDEPVHTENGAEFTYSTKGMKFDPNPDTIEKHMAFLASDALLGRETGTAGYDKAAEYTAKQFEALGLKPAGDNGTFFQKIQFKRAYRIVDSGVLNIAVEGGREITLTPDKDFAIGPNVSLSESTVTAPVIFAGYGIIAPNEGRNDYEGLDVKGKIVATLAGTPDGIQTEERAYYGSRKGFEASQRGAIGLLSIPTPTREKIYSFERLVKEGRLDSPRMSWVSPEGETFTRTSGIRVGATLSMEGAEKIFSQAPISLSDILTEAESDSANPARFALPITATLSQKSKLDEVYSANVAGMIEGIDPLLKNEFIVLTAHLDHIGVSKTNEEDVINNGALDNAAGIATLFEAARMIQANGAPRRSVLFLAVTAEEKGLLGSQYFAKNPTVPKDKIVANVNLDMPILTYDFQDVIAFGGDRSTIRNAISKASKDMGLVAKPDPMPEQGIFTRSDHFRFVEEGIPSVMLATGFDNGGQEAWAIHFSDHYHRPSDDMTNDLDFKAAAKFSELKTRITYILANANERPLWNKDDFFATQFNGPMTDEAAKK